MKIALRKNQTAEFPSSVAELEKGFDRHLLTLIEARFLNVNHFRLVRTKDAIPPRQHIVVDLLTTLFHINHPTLPGFTSPSCPAGISHFTINDVQLKQLDSLSKKIKISPVHEHNCTIQGIFAMGSPGTIAHAEKSDLDVWVCHDPGLDKKQRQLLEEKCSKLSRWAMSLGLELHCFLVNPDQFRGGKVEELSEESSGSAQHHLLLDEFYRTALWLGGRKPLWWYIPPAAEGEYQGYGEFLLKKLFIRPDEVVNLGGLSTIPAEEFVGAAIWQLYKGIESPHKSLLKLLQLESYARNYPNIEPLCLHFKQDIFDGKLIIDDLDPYVQVYNHLATYLNQNNEIQRLDIVRRCLYLKIGKNLSGLHQAKSKSWQRKAFEKIVHSWDWTLTELQDLDNRDNWKAPQVCKERNSLVTELHHSYQLISQFAEKQNIQASISATELEILGRKLNAAFDKKQGKIEKINPGISKDLGERHLTIVALGSELKNIRWAIYNLNPNTIDSHTKPLKQSNSLLNVLTWSHLNGLLVNNSRTESIGSIEVAQQEFQQFTQLLQRWISLPRPKLEHSVFTEESHTQRIVLVINAGLDGFNKHGKQGRYVSLPLDQSIQTIDCLSCNNWDEFISYHFDNKPIIEVLQHVLSISSSSNAFDIPDIEVECFNINNASAMQRRIAELIDDILIIYFSSGNQDSRYLFEFAEEYYLIQCSNGRFHIKALQNSQKIIEHLGLPQKNYSPLIINKDTLIATPLRLLGDALQANQVQIFYRRKEKSLDIILSDEKGSLYNRFYPQAKPSTLISLQIFINNYLRSKQVESGVGLPGFSDLPLNIYEIITDAKKLKLSPRKIIIDLDKLPFLHIKAVASPNQQGGLQFTLFCNEEEFNAQKYGDKLYQAVASWILSKRKDKKGYSCYITELDLSGCEDLIDSKNNLQLCHYLKIKDELELGLNAALKLI